MGEFPVFLFLRLDIVWILGNYDVDSARKIGERDGEEERDWGRKRERERTDRRK